MIRVDDNTVFNPENGEFGYLPEIIQFEVDKILLTDSTPAIVTWTVSNATTVLINNEVVEPTGSKEFYSNGLLEVVLIAENELGQSTPQRITINIDRTPPIIHFFTINEKFAIKGFPIKLLWNIEGAHSLIIDNSVGDVSGTTEKITTLVNNGIYKISAKNYFGIESTSETAVIIFPTPIIDNIFIPKPELKTQVISSNQPTFNISLDFNESQITPNINFVELNSSGTKILSETITINRQFNNLDPFDYLIKKQKEITYILKSVWKREAKQILKRILRQN
jgi:hypothetical protein